MRLLAAITILCSAPVFSADPFYFGTWKITSAQVAPWWDSKQPPDPVESRQLTGRTVVIEGREIRGPRQLACKGPKYAVHGSPAEELFQGMFDEMHRRDASADPRKVAAEVGFRGTVWQTLETGCGNEIEYHFLDPGTAAFGLNNYIFILKKTR